MRFTSDVWQTKYLTELLVSWLMLLVSLPLCFYVLYHTRETNYDVEKVVRVEDVGQDLIHGAAIPKGHHIDARPVDIEQIEEKGHDDGAIVSSV